MKAFISPMMIIVLFLSRTFFVAKSEPNTNVKTLICNVQSYSEDDPFANSVAYVLADLMNVAPTQDGFNYYTESPYPTSVAYGHATCSQSLANSECANCLASAKSTVSSTCYDRIGGQVAMVDCTMRFESYSFT